MKGSFELKISAALIGLFLAMTLPVMAQTASSSYHSAGESVENAGSSTGHAVEHAWKGTKTAVKDTDITAKVKLALHNDKLTKGQDISVDTSAGIVTLHGDVASHAIAERAVRVAENTTGVRGVHDHLHTITASNSSTE